MQTDQHPDSYIYIALILAVIAAFASTSRSPAPPTGFSTAFVSAPANWSPASAFGEAIPWEPSADEPDLTAPP